MIELVGGPLCGAETAFDTDEPDKDVYECPYYRGIALYRVRAEGGKADYIGEYNQ